MTIEPWAVAAAGFVISLLFGVLAWLARGRIERVEKDLEEERKDRVRAVDEERKAREQDRHDLRDQINAVGGRLSAFELVVAKECINGDRLTAALKPLADQVAGVQQRIAEFRGDIKEIYGRLDGKQDKGND